MCSMRKLLLMLLIILVSACTPQVVPSPLTLTFTNTPPLTIAPLSTNPPTAKPSETPTLLPTKTDLPSVTPTSSSTPTMMPTQFLGFEKATVYESYANDTQSTFYIIVPYVDADYYGKVDESIMTCKVDRNYQNMLICTAAGDLTGEDFKTFEFYADEAMTYLVFKGELSTGLIYKKPTPTFIAYIWPKAEFTAADITWGGAETWCPLRGQKITCETEYRNYDGQCFVGHTCADECGFFYSVDTIKDRTGSWVGWGPCIP